MGMDKFVKELRMLPAYGIRDAAKYLHAPEGSVAYWIHSRETSPIIRLPKKNGRPFLSFVNLVEIYILNSLLSKEHHIPLQAIRKSVDTLRRRYDSKHPLAEYRFKTFGRSIFIEDIGRAINISDGEQLAMAEVLNDYLKKVEYDEGLAFRLNLPDDDICIDPRISFGRPAIAGTGIPTFIIAERAEAGESKEALATEYNINLRQVEAALECERLQAAA